MTLGPEEWLNDQIINWNLLTNVTKYGSKVLLFSTFFYSNFKTLGYSSVRRYTKDKCLLEYEKVLIPVHVVNHWVLCVIHIDRGMVEVCDSNWSELRVTEITDTMKEYLHMELKYKEVGF